MPATANKARIRRLEKAKRVWMCNSWVAMGGHTDDFPGAILETLTEPRKFRYIAALNASRDKGNKPA
jgi:hypothetical protein